ncbi:MAG TPA: serine/threonine-protein kinase [Candidatus Methylomirabilis sp.]|nr:serine/threonine-protein kinase [Candidatus Methylomirabilis sp.]
MPSSDIKTQILSHTPGASTAVAPDVAAPLASRYEVLDALGEGGMGMVYRVRDRETTEVLALKVLRPEIARDPAMMERFKNELRLARRITHKNVCRIHDFNRVGDLAYLTMEYVDGESLRLYLRRVGRLTPERTIDLARQMCAGLGEAHAQGVVHRDLKPENVMLGRDGLVKILDFGIARALGADTAVTRTLAGTPEYMAPEQSQGKTVDQRADLYGLGLILYECLTGRRAFSGATPVEVALKQLKERPLPPRKLMADTPPHFEAIVMRCLEKEPARRFASAAELQRALAPPEISAPRPARRWSKAAAVAALAVLAIGVSHRALQHADSPAAPAVAAPLLPPSRVTPPPVRAEEPVPPQDAPKPDDAAISQEAAPAENAPLTSLEGRKEVGNEHKMFFWIERAARRGNHDAQFALGRMYEQGNGVARDLIEAYAWYRRAAVGNNAQARKALARLRPELTSDEHAAAELRAGNTQDRLAH